MALLNPHLRTLAAAALLGTAAAAAEPLEYAVKAAYLSKFSFYVEWPAGSFSGTSAVNLCVIGEDPFGPQLDEAVAGQQLEGRPLAVRRLKAASREAGCHIAYFGEAHPAAALEPLRGAPVLVVTDARSAGVPGAIQFVVKDDRVRFVIDEEAAAQNGLKISSKLLGLALSVKPKGAR